MKPKNKIHFYKISDDEEEPDEMEDYESDIEEDGQGRLVEYDSEENEVRCIYFTFFYIVVSKKYN